MLSTLFALSYVVNRSNDRAARLDASELQTTTTLCVSTPEEETERSIKNIWKQKPDNEKTKRGGRK